MQRILIATDGSDRAQAAVEEGVALARSVGAAVTFVTVRHAAGELFGDPLYQERLTGQLRHAREAIGRAEAVAEQMEVESEAEILEGDPVECIVRVARAWNADLVVVGSRGHGAVTSALIGSVSHGLVTRSTVPVLVVPASVRSAART
ncbi:MAG TPA: universal stress protein [Gaiellaceae bacterium]|jgi:nucleotide-binding universal stress UspA family protein